MDLAPACGVEGPPPTTTVWTDALELGLLGRGWPIEAMGGPYARLPAHAEASLCNDTVKCAANCQTPWAPVGCEKDRCAVWGLSQTTTGMSVKFATRATQVHVRVTMEIENGDWLWPVNGHSGVDYFVQSEESGGQWRWATSSGNNVGNVNGSIHKSENGGPLTSTLGVMAESSTARNITVYLPSRGTVTKVEIGVAPGQQLTRLAPPPSDIKPIVVYGTSILHGAATLHAGMVYSSQMERLLRRPVLNLGFSGHGLMQQEVGELLAEIDAAVYVLDCEWNMCKYNESTVACLTYDFMKQLRAAKPHTPVLLAEGHDATKQWMAAPGLLQQNQTRNGYRTAFNRLLEEGHQGVFYLNGSGKLGGPIASDFEAQVGAVGGCHVTDFAFLHFAQYIGGKVEAILAGSAGKADPKVVVLPVTTAAPAPKPGKMKWVEGSSLGLEGRGWPSALPAYGRLPLSAQKAFAGCATRQDVHYTYNLSQCSAGVLVRFATDARNIQIEVQRRSLSGLLSLTTGQDDIMSYNGRFGIDVYASDEHNGDEWRWFATSGSSSQQAHETLSLEDLAPPPPGDTRKYTVYLPTHIAVDSLKIGVPEESSLAPYRPHAGKAPVLIWASSIGQGGVVQNAGMPWISQVGRALDREVFNFGFSGNCQMQPEVATYLLKLKPSVFVVDCLPNMGASSVEARAPALLKQLRAGLGPKVPIVLLEGHTYSNAWLLPSVRSAQEAKRAAQKAAFDEAAKTDPHLHYVKGDDKLSALGDHAYEATGGIGVHPSNIAHMHIGNFVAKQIRALPDWEK